MPAALTVEEKKERINQVRSVADRPQGERKRNTFNGTTGKLTINHRIEGYALRVFNDMPGRLQDALEGGWEFVKPSEVDSVRNNVVSGNTDIGEKIRFLVNPTANENQQHGYLMKIKQEWFDEDQGTLQAKNNIIDDAIRGGKNPKDGSSDGFYVPKDGIKYGQSNKF